MKKTSNLAGGLALLAALLCFGNFAYKYFNKEETDYFILLAGVFITLIGISAYSRKTKE